MPEIHQRCAWYLPEICLIFAWDILWIFQRCAWYAWVIPKICLIYSCYIVEIFLWYAWNIQSVSKKLDLFYDQYLHQITHKSAGKIFYLKGGIHSSVWSTKKILYDIREPRYNQIKMGYQIVKEILYWTIKSLEISCLISFCLFFGSIMLYKNGFQHETCLRMSP